MKLILVIILSIICTSFFAGSGYSDSPDIIDVHAHFSGWLYKGSADGYEKAALVGYKNAVRIFKIKE